MADKPVQTETPEEELKEDQPQEVEETKEDVQEESPDESQTEPSQVEEEPEESQATEQEEVVDEDPEPMSRRKAKRLEKLEGLVERLKGPQTAEHKSEGINYRELLDADDEVYDQLETKSKEFGTSQYNAGLEQAKSIQFHTRLEIDAPRVEAKYPQFDKESPDFNPHLANSVNEWYLATTGYNPKTDTVNNANVRYADFVEGIMEVADAMASSKNTKSAANIAKQAASTSLRPDGSRNKSFDLSKAPEDMSDEELSAAISQTLPRDARGRFLPKN